MITVDELFEPVDVLVEAVDRFIEDIKNGDNRHAHAQMLLVEVLIEEYKMHRPSLPAARLTPL